QHSGRECIGDPGIGVAGQRTDKLVSGDAFGSWHLPRSCRRRLGQQPALPAPDPGISNDRACCDLFDGRVVHRGSAFLLRSSGGRPVDDPDVSFIRTISKHEIIMTTVDLNADLGEGFGTWRCGDDDAMLSIVTSANDGCGCHAGDPEIMARTFKRARERGVAVGAHPGFRDLWGFGRRKILFTAGEIERMVAYQIGAAQALAACAGHRITYVK